MTLQISNSNLDKLKKSELITLVEDYQLELDHLRGQLEDMRNKENQLSEEEKICIRQIRFLHSKAMQEELTYDEVKRFDVFVKNLQAIRGTTVVASKKKTKTLPVDKLMEIAGTIDG